MHINQQMVICQIISQSYISMALYDTKHCMLFILLTLDIKNEKIKKYKKDNVKKDFAFIYRCKDSFTCINAGVLLTKAQHESFMRIL